jgi:hypothetical protein
MIAGFGALAVDAPLIWPAWLPATGKDNAK